MSRPTPLHTRVIEITTRPLDEERLEVHASLHDERHVDLPSYMGFDHPRGVVHHMELDLELDETLVVRGVGAHMATIPFEPSDQTRGEGCRHALPAYQKLVGLRIDPEYPLRVLEAVGATRGCFHILSLAQCLPAAVRSATRRLCAGALRPPAGARDAILGSCVQWRENSPRWKECLAPSGGAFASFHRSIRVEACAGEGGVLAMRGTLRDRPAGNTPAGVELELDLELPRFTIARAEARLDPPPFTGCDDAVSVVRGLHRLSISKGFTGAALEKIGGGSGCAHVFALLIAITPVTPQAAGALAGHLGWSAHAEPRDRRRNPQVDSCHMWRSNGPLTSL